MLRGSVLAGLSGSASGRPRVSVIESRARPSQGERRAEFNLFQARPSRPQLGRGGGGLSYLSTDNYVMIKDFF